MNRNNTRLAQHPQDCQPSELDSLFLQSANMNTDTMYWQALFLSFKKFVAAEQQRSLCSVEQFVLNVNAAKQLYKR